MRRAGAVYLTFVAMALVGRLSWGGVDSPREETGVSAVEVPVYVLDQDGNPVTQLKPGDFTVYEDGRRQEVLFVRLIVADTRSAKQPSPTPAIPASASGVEPIKMPRHFVLLFDLVYNDPMASSGREMAHGGTSTSGCRRTISSPSSRSPSRTA